MLKMLIELPVMAVTRFLMVWPGQCRKKVKVHSVCHLREHSSRNFGVSSCLRKMSCFIKEKPNHSIQSSYQEVDM